MTILSPELRQRIVSAFNLNDVATDIDFAKFPLSKISNPFEKRAEPFAQYKSIIFNQNINSKFVVASEIPDKEPLSTSMDFLFGGPFYRGEVTSIEGGPGVGKTRLCVKIAHEVACSGRVLYIDADISLQPNVLRQILKSLNLPFAPQSFTDAVGHAYNSNYVIRQFNESSLPELSISSLFHVAICSSPDDLFNIINLYVKNVHPDLIIVDSAISLFQSLQGVDCPGGSMIQEFAIEFKKIVQECNCVGIVTNSLRSQPSHGSIVPADSMANNYTSSNTSYIKDTSKPLPFFGKMYTSLWHQRLLIFSKAYFTSTCDLVSSPRYPYQRKNILIQTLTETSSEETLDYGSLM